LRTVKRVTSYPRSTFTCVFTRTGLHPCSFLTIETHYAGLERLRPCARYAGWVLVGSVDEYGEERQASYPCRRCAEEAR
jgi:hypothetical protein